MEHQKNLQSTMTKTTTAVPKAPTTGPPPITSPSPKTLPPNYDLPPPPNFSNDAPPPPPDDFFAPPPPPSDSFDAPPPPPPDFVQVEIKQAPIYYEDRSPSFSAPPPPPVSNFVAPPPPDAPPPPNFQVSGGMASQSNFLSEIQGKSLKPAAPVQAPKVVDARSNLLEGIRSGIKLNSTKDRQIPDLPKKEEKPASVAEILARRIAIQGSDSEDESEGSGWE